MDATLAQRTYLMDLYDRLGWKDEKPKVRKMSIEEASAAISGNLTFLI